ncbi:type 2A phosphatase activator TIP41 [Pholiota conissans]|uniref:Type 2A phosphatase activator TIP41 n=1 Tax=Pholiota conissans TaxID=109636 RepID=A0A9P5Z4T3_9AGAR|nr:type 2A phosphatase activator TIP41 [Pholiota conissans]
MSDIPQHKLLESPNTRSIEINGWIISASTNSISNARECDALQSTLGIPLPEMTFGNNSLTIKHVPSGTKYAFSTLEALRSVKRGELGEGDGGVKVGHADKWLQSRTDPNSALPLPQTVASKPYDWTYTTTYSGQEFFEEPKEEHNPEEPPEIETGIPPTASFPISWKPADPEDPSNTIPLAELSRPDPILYYAEIPLFEDELHDNGVSTLIVRIRVMPTCWFLLSRFTLRVDHVLFRTYDTRIYHSFKSFPPFIVREISGWEAPYERVHRHLHKQDDLSPLTDPTFVAKILSELPKSVSQRDGAKTRWRGLGTKTQIAVLR